MSDAVRQKYKYATTGKVDTPSGGAGAKFARGGKVSTPKGGGKTSKPSKGSC